MLHVHAVFVLCIYMSALNKLVADLLDRRKVIMITGPNASNSYWPNSRASVDHGLSKEHHLGDFARGSCPRGFCPTIAAGTSFGSPGLHRHVLLILDHSLGCWSTLRSALVN